MHLFLFFCPHCLVWPCWPRSERNITGLAPCSLDVPEQAINEHWTTDMADQPYENPTPANPYIHDPSSISYDFNTPPGTASDLVPSSSEGPRSHTGDMEHLQATLHTTNTGLDSGLEDDHFILLGQYYTQDDLGKVIFEHAAKSNRIGIHKREIAAKFRDQLDSLSDHLEEFKEAYRSSLNMPEVRAELHSYIDEWQHLSKRVQELVEVCEEAAETVPLHVDGTYTQEAWDAFMKTFLGVHHLPMRTLDVMSDMEMLIDYYEQDGAQTLDRLWAQVAIN